MNKKSIFTVAALMMGSLTAGTTIAAGDQPAQSATGGMSANEMNRAQDMNPASGQMQHQQRNQTGQMGGQAGQAQQDQIGGQQYNDTDSQISKDFTRGDEDKSGALSQEEFDNLNSDHQFTDVDVNRDGQVSRQELQDQMASQSKY